MIVTERSTEDEKWVQNLKSIDRDIVKADTDSKIQSR